MQLKVKVKLPKRTNDRAGKIRDELEKAVEETAIEVAKLFEATTKDFDKPLIFDINAGTYSATIWTDDENYARLNSGTSAHMIYPRPGGVLVFPNAFGRKTNPGQLYSMPGYKSPDMVFTKLPVLNPGFKPRAFDKAIAKKIRPILKRKVIAALKAGFKS